MGCWLGLFLMMIEGMLMCGLIFCVLGGVLWFVFSFDDVCNVVVCSIELLMFGGCGLCEFFSRWFLWLMFG